MKIQITLVLVTQVATTHVSPMTAVAIQRRKDGGIALEVSLSTAWSCDSKPDCAESSAINEREVPIMSDDVWGDVKEWGLRDHSDRSATISVDPVCGKQVDEAKAAGKTSYAGVVYCFCSRECQNNFEHAPGEYIGQPQGSTPNMIDVNSAEAEDLRRIFHVDDSGLAQILRNRPYLTWDEFKSKNPGFSEPMLKRVRRSGVMISRHDLHRLV